MHGKRVTWRTPTRAEVSEFLNAIRNRVDIDIAGACWTSEPYEGSQETCWVADFSVKPEFDQFFGTHSPSHGYFQACLRLLTPVCEPEPSREIRVADYGNVLVDYQTGLAWQKQFISKDGTLTDIAYEIWCGPSKDAAAIINRFNDFYNKDATALISRFDDLYNKAGIVHRDETSKTPAPSVYPECEKLSMHSAEMSVIRSFLEWANEHGLEFGQWDGDRFGTANKDTEALLSAHFGIDQNKVDAERKAMLAALAND